MTVPTPSPKQGKFDVPVMFLVNQEQGSRLTALATQTGASKSEIGRMALQFYFDSLDEQEKHSDNE